MVVKILKIVKETDKAIYATLKLPLTDITPTHWIPKSAVEGDHVAAWFAKSRGW